MPDYTYKYPMPAITTDIVVENRIGKEIEILLIQRKKNPWKYMWALPGGHFDVLTDPSIVFCAKRELKEETNLDIDISKFQFIDIRDKIDRDPRGRYVTFIFKVPYNGGEIIASDDALDYKWFNINDLPEMAADHYNIIWDK